MKVHYPKLYNMAHLLALYFTASKGSNNYFYLHIFFHLFVSVDSFTSKGLNTRTEQIT